MSYVEIADHYLNLNHVAYIREEDHSQLGSVLAILFATQGLSPLYLNAEHYDELRPLLLQDGEEPSPEQG